MHTNDRKNKTLYVDTIVEMLALTGVPDGTRVDTARYSTSHAVGDGSGGEYVYDADSTATIDGGFVMPGIGGSLSFSGTTFNGTAGTGRWLLKDTSVANVLQFGAVGDDTDATSAILRSDSAGDVVFPAGTFRYNSNQAIASNWSGQGSKTVVSLSATAQIKLSANRQALTDFRITTYETNSTALIDVSNYVAFWKISGIFVTGTASTGIRVGDGLSGTLEYCRVDGASGIATGIEVTNATPGYANAITVLSCRVRLCSSKNFRIHNGYAVAMINCVSEGISVPTLLEIDSCVGCSVQGCYLEGDASSVAVDVIDTQYATITGGTISSGGTGMRFQSSTDCTVAGTFIAETLTTCISLDASSNRNSIFTGYMPFAKVSDNGSSNKLHYNGGWEAGTVASPGISFGTDGPTTGITGSTSELSLVVSGVEYLKTHSIGATMTRNGASRLFLQDTNSLSRDARLAQGTVNGIWYTGPTVASGATYSFVDPATNTLTQLSAPSIDTQTGLLVRVNRSGVYSLDRVTVGAVDSGGSGFRVLRVSN